MAATIESIDIYDPDIYVDDSPHAVFEQPAARLPGLPPGDARRDVLLGDPEARRRRDGLARAAAVLGGGRRRGARRPRRRSSIEQTRNMLLMMDPPRHTTPAQETAPYVQGAGHRADGGPHPRHLPVACSTRARRWATSSSCTTSRRCSRRDVFGELMGIPPEDRPQIHRWAEMQLTSGPDPDVNPDGYAARRQRRLDRHGDVRDAVRGRAPRPGRRRSR